MAWFRTTMDKGQPGLARKAAEASAARLAACEAVSEGVAGVVNVCLNPSAQCNLMPSGQHTLPCRLLTDYSPAVCPTITLR